MSERTAHDAKTAAPPGSAAAMLPGLSPLALVVIAGGVGFAPMLAILRHAAAEGYAHPVRLVYGNRAESQILYREELEAMKATLDLEVHLVLSEPPEALYFVWADADDEQRRSGSLRTRHASQLDRLRALQVRLGAARCVIPRS